MIHPKIGAGWTAVLKEACSVRKDKVQRLRRKADRGPLKLSMEDVQVPPVSMITWCVAHEYTADAETIEANARGGDWDAFMWLRKHECPWNDWRHSACAAEGRHLDLLEGSTNSLFQCKELY